MSESSSWIRQIFTRPEPQRSLNTLIGGSNEYVYLIIGNLGTISGSGMDVVLGMMFIERFYAVFALQNRQVGLAATPFTGSITN